MTLVPIIFCHDHPLGRIKTYGGKPCDAPKLKIRMKIKSTAAEPADTAVYVRCRTSAELTFQVNSKCLCLAENQKLTRDAKRIPVAQLSAGAD